MIFQIYEIMQNIDVLWQDPEKHPFDPELNVHLWEHLKLFTPTVP